MNELKRLAYLQAMGTDTYISLRQVPGAAITRRLAIVRKLPCASQQADVAATAVSSSPQPAEILRTVAAPSTVRPTEPLPIQAAALSAATETPPRFSLATISCGGWLWLEELEHGPLATQQLQLVQAIAAALGFGSAVSGKDGQDTRPEVTQFDWPIHTNRQLDLGEGAARASAAGFIQRKLEQQQCRGLVLLGQSCETRVALDQLDVTRLARTVSTAAMLQDPLLKKQVWRDLRPFIQHA